MRRTVHALAATLVAAATVTLTAGPALARTPAAVSTSTTSPYVALGDSYSSAAGVAPFVPRLAGHLQPLPAQLRPRHRRATRPSSFTDVTCSGAETPDFFAPQASRRRIPGSARSWTPSPRTPGWSPMTIGGNDENVFATPSSAAPRSTPTDPTGNPCQQKHGNTYVDLIQHADLPEPGRGADGRAREGSARPSSSSATRRSCPPSGHPGCIAMPIAMGDVPWLYHEQDVSTPWSRGGAADRRAVRRHERRAPPATTRASLAGKRWIEPLAGPINAFPVHPNADGRGRHGRTDAAPARPAGGAGTERLTALTGRLAGRPVSRSAGRCSATGRRSPRAGRPRRAPGRPGARRR